MKNNSRLTVNKPWDYDFHLDCGNIITINRIDGEDIPDKFLTTEGSLIYVYNLKKISHKTYEILIKSSKTFIEVTNENLEVSLDLSSSFAGNKKIFFYLSDSIILDIVIELFSARRSNIILSSKALSSLDDNGAKGLAEKTLFSPFIKNNIYPIAQILTYVLGASSGLKTTSYWELFNEQPEHNIYVHNSGKLLLSDRWVNADNKNFPIYLNSKNISNAKKQINFSEYINKLLLSCSCKNCDYKNICQGFLKAVDSSYDCSSHKVFLRTLAQHSADLLKTIKVH